MRYQKVIVDTGPLVAFVNKNDRHHSWSLLKFAEISPPLFTCEAVISESCFLLRRHPEGVSGIMKLLKRKLIRIPFRLDDEISTVASLMASYRDVPMSLADGCLVRMSEQIADSMICTLDGDFKIYRKHKRQIIPTIMPDDA